jgi:glycosyltransferase involved in cell wall biosynthesis
VGLPHQASLLFVGSLDYLPNQLALRWWVDDIAPRLPAGLPRLTVVGRHPEALRPAAVAAALDLRGRVDSMVPVLSAASVVVVPLQHGSGTRLKLLEAMAWGRPVVATTKAVEGIPVIDGTHVLVRDDPSDFAAAVSRLWSDPGAAAAMGERARAFAADYDWTAIGDRFADAILHAAQGEG